MDRTDLSLRELDALFEQSPVAMVFADRELRTRRANAAFRQLTGLSDEVLIGRRPSEAARADQMADTHQVERTLAQQVINEGVPVVNMTLERTREGERRVHAWTAYRVTDNGRVLGAVGFLIDITGQAQADAALRQANTRLDLLQRAGTQIGTTLDLHHTAGELAALAVPGLADRVAVELLEPVLLGKTRPAPTRASCGSAGSRCWTPRRRGPGTSPWASCSRCRSPASRPGVPAGELLVARNPAEMRQLDLPLEIVQPLLDRGVYSLITVPLTARGVTLGVATFSRTKNPEPYDEADVRLVVDLTARAAVHIDNARLYTREHDAAVTLQRSLLPRDIPQVPGLDIADRYQPASRAAEIGGDWFDVIPLDRGRVALVVGDVTGHGIHAAAIMGQLRTTTAALARLGCPPGQIMSQLSALVAAHGDEAGATCLYAVYDPWSRRCQLTSAGHPLPALRRPSGTTEFIDLPAGLLLGAGEDPYPSVDRQLPVGSTLAMYTDGLIEQPGQDISVGMSRLARALATGPTQSLGELCDSMLATLAPHPRDDVALLLARTTTTR